jgi:hypothetical protein
MPPMNGNLQMLAKTFQTLELVVDQSFEWRDVKYADARTRALE